MTPCGALCASSPSATTETTSSIWTWILFGDTFCTNTYLQPDDVTNKSIYTEQFLRAGILTQGDLCTEKLLCTKKDVFTYRCFIQRGACPHKQRHVNIFTHRFLATEKSLHRTIFTHILFGTEKNKHWKNVHTDCTKKYTPVLFARKNLTQNILHRSNSAAQKPLRTIVS